jgi:hypothetical protein
MQDFAVMIDSIVFLGAFLAYTGLGISNTLTSRGVLDRRLAIAVAVIVTLHVFGVWSHRYAWQFDQAVRNGYAGFLIFHSALIAIDAAAVTTDRISVWLHRAAFLIVSMGAVGATFRYDVVAVYRIPVLFVLAMTLLLSFRFIRRERAHLSGSVDLIA